MEPITQPKMFAYLSTGRVSLRGDMADATSGGAIGGRLGRRAGRCIKVIVVCCCEIEKYCD